ncbi:helix-turn-helix domain-containing protein [Francisella sp. Scap27]|nr:helix-turn-helix domain-containing protein [Francisella sp. Scap27]QLE78269.1 helix-turn-helix domain-containing protein [Francisella sp. Scap27]
MKIPHQKEFAMKKAIMIAIEKGESVSKLASYFGVSKSTIYKYRRSLRDQGFIIKNENEVYVVTENKFSKKPHTPKTAKFNFDNNNDSTQTKVTESCDPPAPNDDISVKNTSLEDINNESLEEIPTSDAMEQRLQSKVEKMRDTYEESYDKKGLFKKLFSRFVKN